MQGAGFVLWLISRGTPPAAIGALPPEPAKTREVLPPGIHLPPPSIRPLIMALGLMVICFGVVLRNFAIAITPDFNIPIILVIGLVIMAAGLFGWIRDDYQRRETLDASRSTDRAEASGGSMRTLRRRWVDVLGLLFTLAAAGGH